MNALEALKTQNRRELMYFIKDDVEAKRVMLAWTIYGPLKPPKKTTVKENASFEEIIEAAWSGADQIDMERLSKIAGISERSCERKFELLVLYGLIYPDGTSSQSAMAILRAELSGKLIGLTRRPHPDQNLKTPTKN